MFVRKFRNGFTLLEMLIVVAIIAILVAVSIPVFGGMLNRAREATDLANERAAKAAALSAFYLDDSVTKAAKDSAAADKLSVQYWYDASSGTVIVPRGNEENHQKVLDIKPYGHDYTATRDDPVGAYSAYNAKVMTVIKSGNKVTNKSKDKIITVLVIYNGNSATPDVELWWEKPQDKLLDN